MYNLSTQNFKTQGFNCEFLIQHFDYVNISTIKNQSIRNKKTISSDFLYKIW